MSLPSPNPLSAHQLNRLQLRVALFVRRGLHPERAEAFAASLTARDAERDDRRACIECKHRQKDAGCHMHRAKLHPDVLSKDFLTMPTVLQRCPVFEFQVPK